MSHLRGWKQQILLQVNFHRCSSDSCISFWLHNSINKLTPLIFQVQQTMHRGQRQAKSMQILQAEEMLPSWHEERRYCRSLFFLFKLDRFSWKQDLISKSLQAFELGWTWLVWACRNTHESTTLLMFTPWSAEVSNQLMLSKHFWAIIAIYW